MAIASALRSLLAELVAVGWTIEQDSVHAARVSKGTETLTVRVVTDGSPMAEQAVSGLLSMSLAAVDSDALVPLEQLALTYIRALHSAVTIADLGLLLEAGQAHGRNGHSGLPWSERVFLTYLATCTGAGCHVSGIRLPPWAVRTAGAQQVMWFPDCNPVPHEGVITLSLAQCASVMDSVFRLGRLWSPSVDGPGGL